jgi:hypothetical protein
VTARRDGRQGARDSIFRRGADRTEVGVILEELDEFWEEVRKKRSQRDPLRMLGELVQIAAMAQRCAEDVVEPMFPSGKS